MAAETGVATSPSLWTSLIFKSDLSVPIFSKRTRISVKENDWVSIHISRKSNCDDEDESERTRARKDKSPKKNTKSKDESRRRKQKELVERVWREESGLEWES